jgi:hypothetical protein
MQKPKLFQPFSTVFVASMLRLNRGRGPGSLVSIPNPFKLLAYRAEFPPHLGLLGWHHPQNIASSTLKSWTPPAS